jgi:hypothetical protein
MFRQGLKNNVKIKLMHSSASLNTLNNIINKAININTCLYKLLLEL